MCSFLYFPLRGPFVYLLYSLCSPRVPFGGLIYFAFIHKKKKGIAMGLGTTVAKVSLSGLFLASFIVILLKRHIFMMLSCSRETV